MRRVHLPPPLPTDRLLEVLLNRLRRVLEATLRDGQPDEWR